ncbi:hypothetical protein JW916_07205 [Candidatus Sumerlaeota bacterium]|nr:hypothetical protein [Candidatus Sumerlaeota bacterium]
MKKTIEDIRNEFIDMSGEYAEQYGFPRTAGLIDGLLFMSREPLSLDDMAERLEVSKASASTNIRLFERWKTVRRVFHRGDRKNYYQIRGNVWELWTEILTTIVKDELDRFTERLAVWKSDLAEAEADDPEEKAFLTARLAELEEYLDAGRHLLDVLMRQGRVTPAAIKKIQIS